MFLIFLMYALTTLPLSKLLILQTQPFILISLRMLAAGALLLGYHFWRAQSFSIAKKHIKDFALVTIFAIVMPYFLRYWGLGHSEGNMVDFLCYSGPLITYVLTGFLKIETFSRIKEVALIIGYVGLLMLAGIPHFSFGLSEFAILISIFSFAYGWIIMRRLVVDHEYTPVFINGCTMFGAGCIALALSAVTEPMNITGSATQFALLLTAIIVISNITVHTVYIGLLKKYSLTLIQLCSFITPVCIEYRNNVLGIKGISAQFLCATFLIMLSILIFRFAQKEWNFRYSTASEK